MELAPWLTEGENRVVVVHISTDCQAASLQCAAVCFCRLFLIQLQLPMGLPCVIVISRAAVLLF